MRIGLSATAVWTVNPEDEKMARKLLDEQPEEVLLDYISEALKGNGEVPRPTITAEELED